MKKLIGLAGVFLLANAAIASAQSRTWVSGLGDDANPCSRTAPCKTFAAAISKTAAGGYINCLDPGGFGAVTITKSITIDGNGVLAGVLASGTNGINVAAGSGDVVIIRNLSIEGASTGVRGISITSGGAVYVENVTIQNFSGMGIYMTSNTLLSVTDTTIKNIVEGIGIYMLAGKSSINRSTVDGTSLGIVTGLSAAANVKHTVVGHSYIGYVAEYSSIAQMSLEDSMSSFNQYGIYSADGATVRMSNVSLFNCSIQAIATDGVGNIATFGNNKFAGNAIDGTFTYGLTIK